MLPKTINPVKFAKQSTQLKGDFSLDRCDRLQAVCHQEKGHVSVELQFDIDHNARVPFISGVIKGKLQLICQRCNSPMQYELDTTFLLSPVESELSEKTLPKKYESVYVENDEIELSDLIEDEILLNLPMVPKHLDSECKTTDL